MGQAVIGGRGDDDRMRPGTAEEGRAEVPLGDVHQHPRPNRNPPPRLLVVAKRQLVAGPAGEVAVGALLEDLGCPLLEVGDRARLLVSRDSLDAGNLCQEPDSDRKRRTAACVSRGRSSCGT